MEKDIKRQIRTRRHKAQYVARYRLRGQSKRRATEQNKQTSSPHLPSLFLTSPPWLELNKKKSPSLLQGPLPSSPIIPVIPSFAQ
jgi:hypothetical protein